MTEAECLFKSNKRSSLPVSIPIHVYRKILKKKCKYTSSNKPNNMSTNTMSSEQQTKKHCQTVRQTTSTDAIINLVAESPAYKRPAPERPVPKRPVPHPQKCERLHPERPTSERPAPERPAPERPAPERPAPERPAPERPAPERSEREQFERTTGIKIQCCEHVCSMPFKYSISAAVNFLITTLSTFMIEKSRLCSDKCTQTDNTVTIEDIDETLKASDPVLRDITTFSNQYKQFFTQLCSMCQVFFKVRTKDNKEFVFSRKKRQHFLSVIKNVIEIVCCDDTDTQPPKNVVTIDVDENELVDNNVSERQTEQEQDNTELPETTEQGNQHNQSQKESVNSVEVATRDNVGVVPREETVVNEQTVTNQTIQRDLREQEIYEPTLMEESVNQNISINNEMNIDQTTFNPQILDNIQRICNTPRSQAARYQHFYQNQNYRHYHNKMFRHPNRGNGRPSAYPQRRTPMRNTERPPAINNTESQSALMFCPYNQQQLQQQFMIQQYYQRNPDTSQNSFPNQN